MNKNKLGMITFGILFGIETFCLIKVTDNFNSALGEIDKKNLEVFALHEELNETELSLSNANLMISELNDDIQSSEIQYAEQISSLETEIDNLTIHYNSRVDKLNNLYTEFLTEDQKFLIDYVSNGGTIENIGTWKCTAYCTEKYKHICGTGSGITASGEEVVANWSVAINKANLDWLPFGTRVYIEGVGEREIMDTGGGVATNQMDCANGTHAEALAWSGAGTHKVWILKGESEEV